MTMATIAAKIHIFFFGSGCTTNGVTATCTQVTATYNYKDFPIVPKIPLFTFLPDQVQSIAMIQTS